MAARGWVRKVGDACLALGSACLLLALLPLRLVCVRRERDREERGGDRESETESCQRGLMV